MFSKALSYTKILSLLITLIQIKNVIAEDFNYSVVVLPSEYGGVQAGVVVDNGTPTPLIPYYNGFVWKGSAPKATQNYYYVILDANNQIINSEANLVLDTKLAGTENLSFQRDPPDASSTNTLNETFGAKYTIGDSIIKGIPRLLPKIQAYEKYSLLYQEGQVPNIRAECSQQNYQTLITSEEEELSLNNCTLTYISPYEEIQFSDITLSIAGMGSRGFKKRPFKVEITDNNPNDLYSRSKFKLRNMVYDCTYIKNKLAIDIETSLGMASGQDGLARFYVNSQPFGLYDLFDPLKKKFIKHYFHPGEEDPKLGVLYKCKTYGGIRYFMEVINDLTSIYTVDIVPDGVDPNTYTGIEDITDLLNFINNELGTASVERIKEVIDVDLLLKTLIVEYLVDHRDGFLIGGNNFNIYRNYETKRFHIWSYDFDATFSKFQTWPTSTTFDQYMIIPDDYLKNRAANEPRPKVNPLVEKLFAIPEIKKEFDQLLLDTVSKVFNEAGMSPRIKYFEEFLKCHMYWDVTQTAKLPTKHFTSLTDAEPAYDLTQISTAYNGLSYSCNGENGLIQYISLRSQTVLQSLGGSVQLQDINTLSGDDQLVGLPIEVLKANDDDNNSSNSGIDLKTSNHFTLIVLTSLFSLIITLLM
ncbi:coth-domain-containing protein [Anaeromyces robustus]|uniref:Coth-domain-containing protein n=1 Tax=Anaeromyces robustus TaxID=1754192 RepID=A0A1Y1XLN6_9FUNG|nr:coth-domain-containing protein [Anaeromyces robustus]|eukprot:ORX86416.1 coth-domain-containing protein [Anaeromyces robustus]